MLWCVDSMLSAALVMAYPVHSALPWSSVLCTLPNPDDMLRMRTSGANNSAPNRNSTTLAGPSTLIEICAARSSGPRDKLDCHDAALTPALLSRKLIFWPVGFRMLAASLANWWIDARWDVSHSKMCLVGDATARRSPRSESSER